MEKEWTTKNNHEKKKEPQAVYRWLVKGVQHLNKIKTRKMQMEKIKIQGYGTKEKKKVMKANKKINWKRLKIPKIKRDNLKGKKNIQYKT